MLFKPLADADYRAFVGIRRGVGPVEDSYLAKQDDGDPTTFSLDDFSSESTEESFNIFPVDICAGRVREDDFKRALVHPLHARNGTTNEYHRVMQMSL